MSDFSDDFSTEIQWVEGEYEEDSNLGSGIEEVEVENKRIICLHAFEWEMTVDGEDPFKYANEMIVHHITYDRTQLLQNLSSEHLENISKKSLKDIREAISEQSTFNVIFVADDLGGMILKQTLLMNRCDEYWKHVTETSTLVFFGSPHRFADAKHCREIAFRLIQGWKKEPNGLEKLVTNATELLLTTSRDFLSETIKHRVINVCQGGIDGEHPEMVVEIWAAKMEIADEVTIGRATAHEFLSHFQQDSTYDKFFNLIKESDDPSIGRLLPPSYVQFYRSCRNDDIPSIKDAAGWAELGNPCPNRHLMESLQITPELTRWKSTPPPNALLLQSNRPFTVGDMAILLGSGDDEGSLAFNTKVFSAAFGGWRPVDDVGALMYQLIVSFIKAIAEDSSDEMLLPDIYDHRATPLWTERQLWVLFRTMLAASKNSKIVFLIAAVERCPQDRMWFIQELVRFAVENERQCRLIMSGDHKFIGHCADMCNEVGVIIIDVDAVGALKPSEKYRNVLKRTLQPFLKRQPKFETVREYLWTQVEESRCNEDAGLSMMLHYLEHAHVLSTKLEMQKELEDFHDLSIRKVVDVLMTKISNARRDWVAEVLRWTTYARIPLTTNALRAVMATGTTTLLETWTNNLPQDIVGDIENSIPQLLSVTKDRVLFTDPDLYRYFAEPQPNKWYIPLLESDWELCKKCISWLSSDELVTEARRYYRLGHQPDLIGNMGSPWFSIYAYAVRFWLVHYRIAAKHGHADHWFIINFLNKTNAVMIWSEVFWEMQAANLKQKGGLTSLKSLHIAVRFDFVECVKLLTPKSTNSMVDPDDLPINIQTAARHGHTDILEHLLSTYKPNPAIIHEVLQDIPSIGCEKALLALVRYIPDMPSGGTTRSLLILASENGWADAVDCLLDCTHNYHDDIYPNTTVVTPFHHAVNQGYLRIIRRLSPHTSIRKSFNEMGTSYNHLQLAAMRGYSDVVKYLSKDFESVLKSKGSESRTALHLAAKNGFNQVVESLLGLYEEWASFQDDDGRTALWLASRHGFLSCVSKLLVRGDSNVADNDENTPLHAAAYGGRIEVVTKLLGRSTQHVDKANTEGDTPLLIALREGHDGLTMVLTFGSHEERGPRSKLKMFKRKFKRIEFENRIQLAKRLITTPNRHGENALLIAMKNDLVKAIEIFLRYNRTWGRNELLIAATRGHVSVVAGILNTEDFFHGGKPEQERLDDILAMLEKACSHGHLTVVQEMVSAGLTTVRDSPRLLRHSLKIAIGHGHTDIVKYLGTITPQVARTVVFSAIEDDFMEEVKTGNLSMVRCLLDNGMNVNYQDQYDNSALILAAFNCHTDILRLLLLRGADTELRDDGDSTAILDAAAQGSVECLNLLIEAGARVNVQNRLGTTPISRAVWSGSLEAVEILLEAGADISIRDQEGHDALSKASKSSTVILKRMLELIQPSPQSLQKALVNAANVWARDAMELLQIHGASVEPNMWPLYEAISSGHEEAVSYFLQRGVDKETIKDDLGTPLQQAIYHQRQKIMDKLLEKKVDVNQTGGPHYTALHVAAFRDVTKDQSYVHQLLAANANVNLHGGRWHTVLHAAVSHSSGSIYAEPIASLLLRFNDSLRDEFDDYKRLPLHLAARKGGISLVNLVSPSLSGSWLDLKDIQELTPIHYAVLSGDDKLVKYVMERCGVTTNTILGLKDIHGWTPLHWAFKRYGNRSVAKFLTQDINDLNIETRDNWTPRRIAIYHGNEDIILELTGSDFNQEEFDTGFFTKRSCESCTCEIYGPAWKCAVCDDYDLCFKCNWDAEKLHPHPLETEDAKQGNSFLPTR